MRTYVLVLMTAAVTACGARVDVGGPNEGGTVADSSKPADSRTSETTSSTSLPTCTWPASLDPVDGSSDACVAARTYLACQDSNGGGEDCLSNDPTQCPGPDLTAGVTYSACVDQCHANEYAVGCGGIGPGPSPSLPAGCRNLPAGPGGGSVGCCPCGSDSNMDGGVDGVTTDASEDTGAPGCVSQGSVTFRMQAPTGDAGYNALTSFGNPGDGNWWYSVATADGNPLQIFLSPGPVTATCEPCAPYEVPGGGGCNPVPPDSGVTATWDGTAVTSISTCEWSPGSHQASEAISCQVIQCMPAGKYVVTMCGSELEDCSSTDGEAGACVSVPFQYPTSSEVVGYLPPL
jgi:hypothetical protein